MGIEESFQEEEGYREEQTLAYYRVQCSCPLAVGLSDYD
jgi:hypothetical protein